MTLKFKLLITAVGLVMVALAAADVAAVATLRTYLLQQTDAQLTAAQVPVERRIQQFEQSVDSPSIGTNNNSTTTTTVPDAGPPTNNDNRPQLISDYFIQLRDADGALLDQYTPTVRGERDPLPELSDALVRDKADKDPFTVHAKGDYDFTYRVLVSKTSNDDILVAAVSLENIDKTVGRLRAAELVVSAVILVALGIAAYWMVRVELRQLDKIAKTAGAIAAGDLSQRVESVNPHTEVGRLSEALNAMLSQIEASFHERTQSAERLRRFATDASHELRTPLTAVRGYAELFRQGAITSDEHLARVMARIESEATRMGLMVEDLLMLARLDQGRPMERETVPVSEVVGDVVNDARVVAPEREITLTADADSYEVQGDRARLHQVFSNLVGNAIAHTPEGAGIHVTMSTDADKLKVAVQDEGPGLPAGSAERIFERFYRIDAGRARTSGGTGLGLAIVKSIVEGHGGAVRAESPADEGAIFTVELPLIDH